MKNFDVVVASLPYVETDQPMMAPGLLKGIVTKAGLTCYTFDFNAEVIQKINTSPYEEKIKRWFMYNEYATCPETTNFINEMVEYVAERILSKNPSWVCLSLFCNTARKFNTLLCKRIKKLYPEKKIVIGGNTLFDNDKTIPYGKLLLKGKLIDHYVVGDGEEPLYNLLTGTTDGANENKFQVLDDLSKQPFGDYDDYNWDLYSFKTIPMYGSRGCVRRCTFCDVYKLWKKFKLRSAEDVFAEMLYQVERTGFRHFYFRDSLINGSISEYRTLMKLIANYNKDKDDNNKIKWNSFFIFRPQEQMPEEDWKLTADGGAHNLHIGIESFVDSVRYHMRKKFTNKDIKYGLEMGRKYGINLDLLIIIGYINETEDDFQKSLQWLKDHAEFSKNPIFQLSIGGTMVVTDLTDLYQQAEDFDITIGKEIFLWENKKINLDYETRLKRKEIFTKTAVQLGYTLWELEKPVGSLPTGPVGKV